MVFFLTKHISVSGDSPDPGNIAKVFVHVKVKYFAVLVFLYFDPFLN